MKSSLRRLLFVISGVLLTIIVLFGLNYYASTGNGEIGTGGGGGGVDGNTGGGGTVVNPSASLDPRALELLDMEYLDGLAPSDETIASYTDVQTALACSNYIKLQKDGKIGSWNSATKLCKVMKSVTSILPKADETLIVQAADSDVSRWSEITGLTIQGEMFCSTKLANKTTALALASNIDDVAGYKSGFDPITNAPTGCLLYNSQSTRPATNCTVTFTGDEIDHPPTTYSDGYRFDSTITSIQPSILLKEKVYTPSACQALLAPNNAVIGRFDVSEQTCELFGPDDSIMVTDVTGDCSNSAASHLVFDPAKYAKAPKMKNSWFTAEGVTNDGVVLSTSAASLSIRDSMVQCLNDSRCNMFSIDRSSNLTTFKVFDSTKYRNDPGSIVYVPTRDMLPATVPSKYTPVVLKPVTPTYTTSWTSLPGVYQNSAALETSNNTSYNADNRKAFTLGASGDAYTVDANNITSCFKQVPLSDSGKTLIVYYNKTFYASRKTNVLWSEYNPTNITGIAYSAALDKIRNTSGQQALLINADIDPYNIDLSTPVTGQICTLQSLVGLSSVSGGRTTTFLGGAGSGFPYYYTFQSFMG